jgi:hypothetical protein
MTGPTGYDWNFVGMSYHTLILNRTYLVLVSDRVIAGAVVRGILPSSLSSPPPEWLEPTFYPNPKLVSRYDGVDIHDEAFLAVNTAGFRIDRTTLSDVTLDLTPKRGMGYVPYSGRIILRTQDGRSRELILLGQQDGGAIRDRLR